MSENLSEIFGPPEELFLDDCADVKNIVNMYMEDPSEFQTEASFEFIQENGEKVQIEYHDGMSFKCDRQGQSLDGEIEIVDPKNIVALVPPSVISNEEYLGPFNFDVFIDPHQSSKSPWVYSPALRKVFILPFTTFPVDFKWCPVDSILFVRATPLFSLSQHSQDLVARCIPHALDNDCHNINMPPHVWDHVIRCQNSSAIYEGDKKSGIHLSVLVPLGQPQSGTDTVRQMYQFMCKNSCPSGMNRRPFDVVFTLEDEQGTVYGRTRINVRVCSCPKRDKEKEENDLKKGTENRPSKKRKLEKNGKKSMLPSSSNTADNKEYTISIPINGKSNVLKVLNYCHDLMAGEILRTGNEQPYKKTAEHILNLMHKPLD